MAFCTTCGALINQADVEKHTHGPVPTIGKELRPSTTEISTGAV